MWHETPLDFKALENWLHARLGRSIEVHLVTERSTVGFVQGPIDRVIRFEGDASEGVLIDGGAGTWSLELALEEFVSARVMSVPDSPTARQLRVTMRQHELMLDLDDAGVAD
jgi:hypothetical protein